MAQDNTAALVEKIMLGKRIACIYCHGGWRPVLSYSMCESERCWVCDGTGWMKNLNRKRNNNGEGGST